MYSLGVLETRGQNLFPWADVKVLAGLAPPGGSAGRIRLLDWLLEATVISLVVILAPYHYNQLFCPHVSSSVCQISLYNDIMITFRTQLIIRHHLPMSRALTEPYLQRFLLPH